MATDLFKGSIVAFEGEPDLVSTQLRLLPTSPQLIILPRVESYIKPEDNDECFSARGFVRQIHAALVARNDAARTFLDGSTPHHKRLVFLNGSTHGAQTLCVREIMKYETNDDQAEAEAIFEDIVRHGVAGLDDHLSGLDSGNYCFSSSDTMKDVINVEEDPVSKAMRAADVLDRQTASLQPSNDTGLSSTSRSRRLSLPLYGFVDEFADSTPFYVFGVRPHEEESLAEDFMESVSAPYTPRATTFQSTTQHILESSGFEPACSSPSIYPSSCVGETFGSEYGEDHADAVDFSPVSESFSLQSSDSVTFGEASILDLRLTSGRYSISRVKSLDRMDPGNSKFQHTGIPRHSSLGESGFPRALQHPTSAPWLSDDRSQKSGQVRFVERPRTIVVGSRLSSVKLQPAPTYKKRKMAREAIDIATPNNVDRGPDAAKDSRYQPVLPPVEDLVVLLFRDDSSDTMLEAAVSGLRHQRYPPLSHSPTASDADKNHIFIPETPTQPSPTSEDEQYVRLEDSVSVLPNADEYDPFAYTRSSWQLSKSSQLTPSVSMVRPPTPAQTPPPTTVDENESKIRVFHVAPDQTAVSVQNSLRSILGEYFPPDTEGYRQFQMSLLPEFGQLWKPMFRGSNSQRGVDNGAQILAIGSQNGVRKEYTQAVIGRLERSGSKSCENIKTGRVDFRYLLANAMQTFTTQRLVHQTSNPFTNPYLLATLIIPHLSTYLTVHADLGYLLLLYPPEHLATVLALQKLIGIEFVKIAQIVDATSEHDSPFTHIRGASIHNKSESKPARPPFLTRTLSDVAVSKANYLLTSTASDEDVATFVSTVWNIGIKEAEVLGPDAATANAHRRTSPSLENDHMVECRTTTPQSSPCSQTTTISRLSRGLVAAAATSDDPSSPGVSPHAPSFAETIRTCKSTRSKRSETKPRTKSGLLVDTGSLASFDYTDDSDDDMDERRLMPVYMQKHGLRTPNSRKALKFLGLA